MERTFLFDIDGTLVDSSAVIESAWQQVAGEFGADASAVLTDCHGRRSADVVADYFRPEVSDAVLDRLDELESEGTEGVVAVPGAVELLTSFDGERWAAVTSGPRQLMAARLRAAGLPVPEVLVDADAVRHGKPDPEGFVAAADALGVPAASCVVVEDSPAGVAAGKAAGAVVVAITTTHTAEALAKADVVVGDLSELRAGLAGV